MDDLLKTIHQNCDVSQLNQKLHENRFGTLLKIKFFGTMRLLWQFHMPNRLKLIDSKSTFMNYVAFKGKNFSIMYKMQSLRVSISNEEEFHQEISVTLVFNIHSSPHLFITYIFCKGSNHNFKNYPYWSSWVLPT